MKRRTKKLLTGAALIRRRLAAQQAVASRLRCPGCGSLLGADRRCHHPACEGQKARPRE